jgi:mono/diheme cytochrome c family protein
MKKESVMPRVAPRTIAVAVTGAVFATVIGSVILVGRDSREARGQAARGEYLVKIMGCNDCHTPMKMGPQGPEADMSRFLSGHPEEVGAVPHMMPPAPYIMAGFPTGTAYSGPWGVSYAANLTPDQNTGLGIWTEDMFVSAIRTGKHMGVSRPIAPPMPWPAFRNASDDDLKSIYAYLRSIRPIVNHVPDYKPIGS